MSLIKEFFQLVGEEIRETYHKCRDGIKEFANEALKDLKELLRERKRENDRKELAMILGKFNEGSQASLSYTEYKNVNASLVNAVMTGDLQKIKECLKQGGNINLVVAYDKESKTLLLPWDKGFYDLKPETYYMLYRCPGHISWDPEEKSLYLCRKKYTPNIYKVKRYSLHELALQMKYKDVANYLHKSGSRNYLDLFHFILDEELLYYAITKENYAKVVKLLLSGMADPTFVSYTKEWHYDDGYNGTSGTEMHFDLSLDLSKSEKMTNILRHFGAVTEKELKETYLSSEHWRSILEKRKTEEEKSKVEMEKRKAEKEKRKAKEDAFMRDLLADN